MTLSIILLVYFSLGLMAAMGSLVLTRKFLPPRLEAPVYGVLLIPIAGLYLVFTRHFGLDGAWPLEMSAVIGFSLLGLLGMRFPLMLVVGYGLHGGWDFAHELHAHLGIDAFGGRPVTLVPLAYGAVCAGYDGYVAVYFWLRSRQPADVAGTAT
ncbi:hypothetical protein JN531_014020 [Flagellatimonas centrodinii]|uniref:DUF6010 family protein n=1 Tax=Flagellatimonas centrodinii TaxID=2806210 RepID=UPI001FED57CC|nr:DUF6010 family protein [Flagellatimonas centrodinii]ULQ46210.1 hypothetical protein JN531_014020 [Flagellatimonas centrodinii]